LRAVVDAYFQQVVNQERTARQDRLHHQKDLLRTLEDEVKSKKMSLRNLGELAGSLPADDSRIAMRRKFVLDRIERTLEKLFETRNRLREHEVEFEMSVAEGETATQRITELDKEIRKEQVLEKILGEELKQLEATVAKSTKPQDSYDLESLRAEIKVDEEILDRLRRQIAEQSIELHAPPRVSLLSPGS
jgi:DNA repair exonuclease SbcCD ATPase subunit